MTAEGDAQLRRSVLVDLAEEHPGVREETIAGVLDSALRVVRERVGVTDFVLAADLSELRLQIRGGYGTG